MEFILKNPPWVAELETMLRLKQQAEIQELSSFGFQFVTQVYSHESVRQGTGYRPAQSISISWISIRMRKSSSNQLGTRFRVEVDRSLVGASSTL
jgi:hypothetical protein